MKVVSELFRFWEMFVLFSKKEQQKSGNKGLSSASVMEFVNCYEIVRIFIVFGQKMSLLLFVNYCAMIILLIVGISFVTTKSIFNT